MNKESNSAWIQKPLGELAYYHNGFAFKPSDWSLDGIKIVRIQQLNNPEGEYDYYIGQVPETNRITNDDLIFSWSATLKVIIWNHGDAILNQHLFRVDLKGNVDKYFLYHVIDFNLEKLAGSSHGSTMKHIKRGALDTFHVFLPEELSEQCKIAQILTTVDNLIKQTQAAIHKYQVIKQGMIQDLFSRGIDTATGRLRPSRGDAPDLYKKTILGWVAKEWKVCTIGACCSKVTDGAHQSVSTSSDAEVPFLYVSSIRDARILWENTSRITRQAYLNISKGREPRKGTVLYTVVGSYGHAVELTTEIELTFQRHIAYLAPDKVNSSFLEIYLNSPFAKRWADRIAVGNAQKTVTLDALSKFPILLPDDNEQLIIAAKIQQISRKIEAEEKALQKYKQIKHGLMQNLLTGRVRVNLSDIEQVREE
jgi:type I restriction enzyme, S subunit